MIWLYRQRALDEPVSRLPTYGAASVQLSMVGFSCPKAKFKTKHARMFSTLLCWYVCWRTDERFFRQVYLPLLFFKPFIFRNPCRSQQSFSMRSDSYMNKENGAGLTILVVDDIEETRDGIEKLLEVNGYRVETARHERDAVDCAGRKQPDLILVSLGGPPLDVIDTARHIRKRAELNENVPVVVFCVGEVKEGDEVDIGQNVYLTSPDNFNQLRSLLARLLKLNPLPLKASLS
jgi:CheY-like chemotaxis protein